MFVAGHSTTLIIATLVGWRLEALIVDVVIALSVAFVGVVGFIGRPQRWGWFALAVLGFGLVHGLGLSTRLQALGLPESGLLIRVIAFNVGVEIGQLLAIVVLVVGFRLVRRFITWRHAPRLANGTLIVAGFVAAMILPLVTLLGSSPAGATGSCHRRHQTNRLRPRRPPREGLLPAPRNPARGRLRPYRRRRLPRRALPDPAAPRADHRTAGLRGRSGGHRVVAGAVRGQTEPLRAQHAYQTLTCAEFDLEALKTFTRNWFADPRSRPPQ